MPDASNPLSREDVAEMMDVPVELLGNPDTTYANAEDDYREQYDYLRGELERHLRSQITLTPNIPTDVAIIMSFKVQPPNDYITVHFNTTLPLAEHELTGLGEN